MNILVAWAYFGLFVHTVTFLAKLYNAIRSDLMDIKGVNNIRLGKTNNPWTKILVLILEMVAWSLNVSLIITFLQLINL